MNGADDATVTETHSSHWKLDYAMGRETMRSRSGIKPTEFQTEIEGRRRVDLLTLWIVVDGVWRCFASLHGTRALPRCDDTFNVLHYTRIKNMNGEVLYVDDPDMDGDDGVGLVAEEPRNAHNNTIQLCIRNAAEDTVHMAVKITN